MPRGMVYNWDGKQAEVYQLYVVERKSLDELAQYMKDKYQFEPRYGRPRPLYSSTGVMR